MSVRPNPAVTSQPAMSAQPQGTQNQPRTSRTTSSAFAQSSISQA